MRTVTAAAQQFADGLFGQTRGRILVLLYSSPRNRSYSTREIARLIGMSVGTVHRDSTQPRVLLAGCWWRVFP
jgi:DNA-binding MarR family transcriptional regulator